MGLQARWNIAILGVFVPLLAAAPARAVIELKNTLQSLYGGSDPVVVGTITRVNADARTIEVKTTETLKGNPFPDMFRVQVQQPPDLIKSAVAGQPVVLMGSKQAAGKVVLHLGDTWLLGTVVPSVQPPTWRAAPVQDDKPRAFPGRTEAFVRALGEIKAGKSILLNKVDNKRLHGGIKELAKLSVAKPPFLVAADVNGDKKPDLLVGTADGVKLFLAAGTGYEDATAAWGLAGANGARAAAGDVNHDGKADLLIGKTLWMNDGHKFTAAKAALDLPDGASVVAEALIDANGDAKPDAVVLLSDGQLLSFTNLGLPEQPWAKGTGRKVAGAGDLGTPLAAAFGDFGDNGKACAIVITESGITRCPLDADAGPPGDFTRLTGEKLASQKGFAQPTKAAGTIVLDLNGDGRPDVVVVADGGNVVLVNRGFGAFLVDPDAGAPLDGRGEKALPARVTPATAWTAANLDGDGTDDVLVLTEDGRLFVVANPPAAGTR